MISLLAAIRNVSTFSTTFLFRSLFALKTNTSRYCVLRTHVFPSHQPISLNIVCVVYCYSITLYARATGWVLLRCAVDCFCCVHFSSVDRWSKGQKWNLLPIIYLLLRIWFGSNQYARVLNHSHTYTHISTIRQMSIFQMLFVNDDEFSVFDRLIFNNILNFIYRFFTTSWTH